MKSQTKTKILKLTALIMVSLIGSVSCQKNDKKSGASPAPIVGPTPIGGFGPGGGAGCTNCFTTDANSFLVSTDSERSLGGLILKLDFYGAATAGMDFQSDKIPLTYSGPTQAAGVLEISRSDSSVCNLPVGSYQITTLQAGTWASGVMAGRSGLGPTALRLSGSGNNGIQVVFILTSGVVYNGTSPSGVMRSEINRLGVNFKIESINNQACENHLRTGPLVLY